MIRDPRASVASLQRQRWASRSVVTNAHNCLACNLAARRCRQRPEYLEVGYETLATENENEVGRICAFKGKD